MESRSIYISKSSALVKVVTIGTLVILALISLTLMTAKNSMGVIGGTALSILIIGAIIYFYANSLDKIILSKDNVTLKKKDGHILISKSDIISVHKLEYSNLTMTYGSKGVFGFIGNTIENSVSLVKDRKYMLRIVTNDKKYIFSSERPGELVSEIKTRYKIK